MVVEKAKAWLEKALGTRKVGKTVDEAMKLITA